MPDGKIRHSNHLTDTRALKFLSNLFPDEWVQREMTPDYGIDIDLELFDYEGGNCITLGEHVFLQVKGTEHAKLGRIKLFRAESEKYIDVLEYSLDVAELNLVERMGSAISVLLLVIDLEKQEAYQICLNDYISKVLPWQNPEYKKQNTVMVYIPLANKLEKNNLDIIYWYGKRAKLYAMFHEMFADASDFDYIQNFEYPERGKAFIEKYRNYDVWRARKFWYPLEDAYQLMEELYQNNCICSYGKSFILCVVENKEKWETETVYEDFYGEEPISAYLAAQKHSIRMLIEKVRNISAIFEDMARNWFMPTDANLSLWEDI